MVRTGFFSLLFLQCLLGRTQEVQYKILSSAPHELRIGISFPNFKESLVKIGEVCYTQCKVASCYPIEKLGKPELLQCAFSIIIPDTNISISIIETRADTLHSIDLIPSQVRSYRDRSSENSSYYQEYQKEAYLQISSSENAPVTLSKSYQFRDYKGVTVFCKPFTYNQNAKQLFVYKSLIISIKSQESFVVPAAEKITKDYDFLYRTHFLNYLSPSPSKDLSQGELLIIAYDDFVDAVQPLATWKNRCGISTVVTPLSAIGTHADSVKNYVARFYKDHNLSYLITVGDAEQFPPLKINGIVCDNGYANIVGDDYYPDIMTGKISAETVEQVALQVQKIVDYEQNNINKDHKLSFIGIASEEGPGDNNEYDFEHIQRIDSLLLSSGVCGKGYEFFDGTHGGLDDYGDPTPEQVAQAINGGIDIINYCGRGDWNKFVTSSLSNNKVAQLQNVNPLPIIISTACLTGQYDNRTCFAETWLRAHQNGVPTGAVAALMSTIRQEWNPPMCGQDEMNRLLIKSITGMEHCSLGAIIFGGMLKMLDIYGDWETYLTWLLFGDPSLQIAATPSQIVATNAVNSVMLVPNPAVEKVCVKSTFAIPENSQLYLCDIAGKTLYRDKIKDTEICIDLTDYKSGIYFIKILSAKKEIFISKLIKL